MMMSSVFVRHRTAGFTLMELMVVMAILGLIAAFAGPQVFKALDKAQTDAAKAQISSLSTAISQYRLEVGKFPPDLNALVEQPAGDAKWDGPYLNKKSVPKDPWDNDYVYKHPGDNGDFDLLSYGADGSPGGDGDNADVVSWE
ncbi:MAG: type II secretion system major pseudopilin GspG [Chromatiales bacterium]|jgi:general secretion pathway protein G|nr:type II secretion system major pseudopilin GspG [Chromatiales bacterium]